MVDQVTFPPSIGGSGKTYTNDANPQTGMFNGGHRVNFFPILADTVAAAGYVSRYAQAIDGAKANADRAEDAKGYVEAVADQYRVNITEQLRLKSSVYLNFQEGVYQVDGGVRTITSDINEVANYARSTDKRVVGPNGVKRVIPAGVLARFWKEGIPKGYLPEGSRTNALLHSNDFTQSVWSKNGVTIEDGQIDPYGTNTAQKLVENSGNGFHNVLQNINVNTGEFWGVSFSILPLQKPRFQARIGGAAFQYVQFSYNAITDEVEFLTQGAEARVSKEANGFIQIKLKLPVAIETGIGNLSLNLADNSSGSSSYQGDGQSGAIFTEPQFEKVGEKGWPSSHIPTTTAPTTRDSDNLVFDVSDYISGNQGTLFVRYENVVSNLFPSPVQLSGTPPAFHSIRIEHQVRRWRLAGGGIPSTQDFPILPSSVADHYSSAVSWKDGEMISAGSGLVTSPNELNAPIGTELRVGRSYDTTATVFNGGVMEVMLLPFALEPAVLAALTAEGV